jgi:hypothetical protein
MTRPSRFFPTQRPSARTRAKETWGGLTGNARASTAVIDTLLAAGALTLGRTADMGHPLQTRRNGE